MTCPACQTAEQNPTSGLYQANCEGCSLRAIAGGRELFEASKAGGEEYKSFLKAEFGDGAADAHKRIVQWKRAFKGQA